MRSLLQVGCTGLVLLAAVSLARGQSPNRDPEPGPSLVPAGDVGYTAPRQPALSIAQRLDQLRRGVAQVRQQPAVPEFSLPAPAGTAAPMPGGLPTEELGRLEQEIVALRSEQAAAQAAAPQDEQKKLLELQQKQLDLLEKMVKELAEQVRKQPNVEKLETQVTTLESRSVQAARRDQELAKGLDILTEHVDAQDRYGPELPATLKELFLPSRTNETPLSIYGTLVGGYRDFPHHVGEGEFFFDGFEPIFLLQLNDHILLETELEFHGEGVEVGYAQMDLIVNNWLTVVAGRYLAPIGFFNERQHAAWINKLPDFPLMMEQVSLADFSLNGVQLRGAKYLCCSDLKMEYSLYVANGIGAPGEGTLTDLADLGALKDTTHDVNEAMAFGGRLGFWLPEAGVTWGFSAFFNRPYGEVAGPDINLVQFDAGYHRCNWDARFEIAHMFEETSSFLGNNIDRWGLYAQVAYRPYDAHERWLQNTEFVFRYSYAQVTGVDPTKLDLTAFETPVAAPVTRHQFAFGVDYYIYPSLVVKLAYEINRERGIDLKDDAILGQVAWGF
jgi:hypothetical protein